MSNYNFKPDEPLNMNYASRGSFLSEKLEGLSSLNESRGIILENFDGTYHHGIY